MTARFGAATLLALGVLAAGCADPRTEILLVVGSDLLVPTEIDSLTIHADGNGDAGLERTFDLTKPATSLPLSLGLVSKDGQARPLHVVVTVLSGTTPIVTRSATTAFVVGQVRVLSLELAVACRGVVCAIAGDTCVAGVCGSDAVPGTSLPPYGVDAGPLGLADAGDASAPDVSADAVASDASDATTSDAHAPEGDAAPRKDDGVACGGAGECTSGHCADGVCCATSCVGACVSCALPARPGTCSPISAGTPDPHGVCADQGAPSCGTSGQCDGAGACAPYPAGTTCAVATCSGDSFVGAAKCASGACAAPAAVTCDPGACDTTGCAPSQVLTYANVTPTAAQGYTGSEAAQFSDACPVGQVVIGFNTTSNAASGPAVVDQIQTICGIAKVPTTGGAATVTAGTTLIVRGDVAGTAVAATCPANQVVVGFDGRAFALLDQLSIRCAPVAVAADGGVTIGTPTNLAPVGGTGGDPFPRTDCGPGAVAVGANIYTRSYVSAFGLACATVGAQ
jgi:hypothetical protein